MNKDVSHLVGDLDSRFDALRKCDSFSAIAEWLMANEHFLHENIEHYGEKIEILEIRCDRIVFKRYCDCWAATLCVKYSVKDKTFFGPGRSRSPFDMIRGSGMINMWEISRGHFGGYSSGDFRGFWRTFREDRHLWMSMDVALTKDVWSALHVGQKLRS